VARCSDCGATLEERPEAPARSSTPAQRLSLQSVAVAVAFIFVALWLGGALDALGHGGVEATVYKIARFTGGAIVFVIAILLVAFIDEFAIARRGPNHLQRFNAIALVVSAIIGILMLLGEGSRPNAMFFQFVEAYSLCWLLYGHRLRPRVVSDVDSTSRRFF